MSIDEKVLISSNSERKSVDIRLLSLFANNNELQTQNLLKSSYDFQANSNFFNSSIIKCSQLDFPDNVPTTFKARITDFSNRIEAVKIEIPSQQIELKKRTVDEMWADCMQDFESEEDMFTQSDDEHSISEFHLTEHCIFEKANTRNSKANNDRLLDFQNFLEKFEKKAETKNVFLCPQCLGKSFTSKQALGGHFGQVHRGESFQYLRRLKVKNQNQQVRKRLGYYKELKKPDL